MTSFVLVEVCNDILEHHLKHPNNPTSLCDGTSQEAVIFTVLRMRKFLAPEGRTDVVNSC